MEHFRETSESIKEECFFGTFNTEDILTAPACELNDPITTENVQNASGLTTPVFEPIEEELVTNNMVTSITDTVATEFVTQSSENGIKIEDTFPNEKPSSTFGIKIADFAVDPDSCVIVSTPTVTQSNRTTKPKESTEPATPIMTDQLKFQLKRLSFIHALRQYEKVY